MAALTESVTLRLEVRDRETCDELLKFPEGPERDNFALTALRIGVLALRQARGDLDIQAVRREADRLIENLQQTLKSHQEQLTNQIRSALCEYFDPSTGKLHERIQRLIGNGGELEQFLRQYIGREDSELCKTLMMYVGKDSRLMQYLSPEQRNGLLDLLQQMVEKELAKQREQVLRQFSLNEPEGALCRFLEQLREHQNQVSGDLQSKITTLLDEFSLDRPDSALSRLVRNVDEAQKRINAEFSLDQENSALSRLRRELMDQLENLRENQQQFQLKVMKEIAALQVRREEIQRSARHGLEFEQALFQQLQREVYLRGHLVDFVGDKTGKGRSKVGDILIQLNNDSAAAGAKIVVEAKEQQNYSQKEALEEIAKARENRDAQIGLFVFSKKTAPRDIPPLTRWDRDIITVWDADDPTTDVYLQAAVLVAQALCLRVARDQSSADADIKTLEEIVRDLEKMAERLESIANWAASIKQNSDKITDETKRWRDNLERQVKQLQDCLGHLHKHFAQSGSPVAF